MDRINQLSVCYTRIDHFYSEQEVGIHNPDRITIPHLLIHGVYNVELKRSKKK
jgi:hypothetical protein